jgi:hypothetical protein
MGVMWQPRRSRNAGQTSAAGAAQRRRLRWQAAQVVRRAASQRKRAWRVGARPPKNRCVTGLQPPPSGSDPLGRCGSHSSRYSRWRQNELDHRPGGDTHTEDPSLAQSLVAGVRAPPGERRSGIGFLMLVHRITPGGSPASWQDSQRPGRCDERTGPGGNRCGSPCSGRTGGSGACPGCGSGRRPGPHGVPAADNGSSRGRRRSVGALPAGSDGRGAGGLCILGVLVVGAVLEGNASY